MKLGDVVKDKYSPFSGIIVTRIEQFSGVTRYMVQGSKDGEPTHFEFDDVQLEVVQPAEEDKTPKPSGRVKLGDKVRDIASGWEGICTGFYLYLNGCVRYEISGAKSKKDKIPHIVALDEALVEPLGESRVSAMLKRSTPAEPQGPRRTGGARGLSPIGR